MKVSLRQNMAKIITSSLLSLWSFRSGNVRAGITALLIYWSSGSNPFDPKVVESNPVRTNGFFYYKHLSQQKNIDQNEKFTLNLKCILTNPSHIRPWMSCNKIHFTLKAEYKWQQACQKSHYWDRGHVWPTNATQMCIDFHNTRFESKTDLMFGECVISFSRDIWSCKTIDRNVSLFFQTSMKKNPKLKKNYFPLFQTASYALKTSIH